jgi:hypothetical protein
MDTLDSNGNFTGQVDTSVDVTSGFSFAIKHNLSSASVTGSGIPAQTCSYDANFNLIGCSNTTIDVSADWAGQGPLARGTSNDHFKMDGFSENDHFNGTQRNATATGNIAGLALTSDELEFADMGTTNAGSTFVCVGNSC